MAELALGVVSSIFQKSLPLAVDQISRAWGLNEDLQKLAGKLEMMQALISDAQTKQLTSRAVQVWLKKLQSIARDAEIVLDDYGYEVLRQKVENRKRDKVHRFVLNPPLIVEMANKIKDVGSSLEEAYTEADRIGLLKVQLIFTPPNQKEDRLTDPFVDESEIVGRKDDVSKVVSMLMGSDYRKDLPVISVVGMAGQGKTTLAQMVHKDDRVVKYFKKRIWVCVSDDFKVERLLNEMLQSLGGTKSETTNREALVRALQENLQGKRYLLVLDDLWNRNSEKWDCMRKCLVAIKGSQGSKVLATTRSDEVASAMQTSDVYQLGVLSDDDSWMLFEKLAFAGGGARMTQDLADIGKRILKRCGGVPLAIKVIGGLLHSKKEESEWLAIEKSEKWNQISDVVDDGVFSILKLSYDHLPSLSVKQCFASCSIFPKDTRMEKERLIQIWMAQGLINHSKGGHLEMEDIGSSYFNILLQSSLLQDPIKNDYNEIISCKMHDLVHDLSLRMSNNGFFNTEDSVEIDLDNNITHLTLFSSQGKMLKRMKGVPPRLQTLYLVGDTVLEKIFKTCMYLCVLIVKCSNVSDLPNEVGDMKHLRYLDIMDTRITTLPDSITKLYNLMTLRVYELVEIPKGFGNLINLRHIYFPEWVDKASCLFPTIGQLANLQTLPFFVVSQDRRCQIEELEHLHKLKGKLKITGLENLSSYESAAKANLSTKSDIESLELHWEDMTNDCGDNAEGLQPHLKLKSLTIDGFNGSKLPSWMLTKNQLLPLRNLVKIKLAYLCNCEEIPSFGDLPYLRILDLDCLLKVKRIGNGFYGLENHDYPSCSREAQAVTSFPALEELGLQNMYGLVEWSGAKIPFDSSSWIKVFPKLRKLEIRWLPNLAILPDWENFTCLEELIIVDCERLKCLRNLSSIKSLETLSPRGCLNLDANLDMKNPQPLRNLTLFGCDKLISSLSDLNNFTSLEHLKIDSNTGSWPKGLHHPPNLRRLEVSLYSEDIDYFSWPFSIISSETKAAAAADDDYVMKQQQHFDSLETLYLYGGPKITSLPVQIQHFPALRNLHIRYFGGLEALPEWLGCFQNLESLSVVGCRSLMQLPSVEAMQRLTNLRQLDIIQSPPLGKRCTRGSGADWHKIARIPTIYIDLERI